mgnify:CR=1 FL=1
MEILKVNNEDIEKLSDTQLTELLSMLLYFEADKWGISSNAVSVALNINVADGGEDGRIKWEGDIEKTDWLPSRFTQFQCKATDMPPSKCKQEIISSDNDLKLMVSDVIENSGSYILFHNRTLNEAQQKTRIKSFREAIDESNYPGDSESVDIHIYEAGKIAAWTNESISAAVAVWRWLGKHLPNGARTWEEWSGYAENSYSYVLDDTNSSNITQIRNHFSGVKKVARIIGLSGLGKTRLAFEAFRAPEDPNDVGQLSRSKQSIYLDASVNSKSLPDIFSTWRRQGLRGTVIVDNCDPELHKMLKDEVEHTDSQMNLLTLDFNPERFDSDHPYIELAQVKDEIIEGIITQSYPGVPEEDVKRIVEFSQGFPKIAVLLAKARINEDDDIGSLKDDALIDKLLWGRRSENPIMHKVISACALFEYVGYDDDVVSQRKFVTEKICNITEEEFYSACQNFIERGILDRRGRYIRVTPQPLAIRLATDWWKTCLPEKAYSIITADMPGGMSEALCDQMTKLHFLPQAQELTASLCGEQAPFGQAEVLNSEKGSRLFRSLVEVNPAATVRALNRVFGSMSIEELLEVGPGRRNLIWSLEKLCFWEETFESASKLLLMFAAAENESWSNNATSQFLQLFHYVLSGTQASPDVRIRVIDYALEAESIEISKLGVEALGHALQTHHFTRMVGVEKQGSRPVQKEWRPDTWNEVFTYWKNALDRLTKISLENHELSGRATEIIADSIRGLVSHGRIYEVETALKEIIENKGPFWPSALENVTLTIRFDGEKMPSEGLERLQEWKEWLQPNTFEEQLKLIVSIPSRDLHKDDHGDFIDSSSEKAKEFAKHCYQENYNELLDNLQLILVGEQRKGYIFGYKIGELVTEPETLIYRTINTLKEMVDKKVENINLTFLGGILAALESNQTKLVSKVFDEIANCPNLSKFTVELTRFITISPEELDRIIRLLNENKIDVKSLYTFSYGSVLDHLAPDVIWGLVSEIINYNEDGLHVGWEILYMYIHGDDEKFQELSHIFEELIINEDVLLKDNIDNHEIINVIRKYIYYNDDRRAAFITGLMEQIVKVFNDSILSFEVVRNFKKYISLLMDFNWENCWGKLSNAMLSEDRIVVSNCIRVLEPGLIDEGVWILESIPDDELKTWCSEHDKGPELLSAIVPVMDNSGNCSINSIAYYLVLEHGDSERVLINIDRRLGTFSWSGSLIPYIQKQIEVYQMFKNHRSLKVRKWAQNRIEKLNDDIYLEQKREEENELGF